jgi:hypothetical protein
LVAERDAQVCLADAGRPDQQDVGLLFDEPQRRDPLRLSSFPNLVVLLRPVV